MSILGVCVKNTYSISCWIFQELFSAPVRVSVCVFTASIESCNVGSSRWVSLVLQLLIVECMVMKLYIQIGRKAIDIWGMYIHEHWWLSHVCRCMMIYCRRNHQFMVLTKRDQQDTSTDSKSHKQNVNKIQHNSSKPNQLLVNVRCSKPLIDDFTWDTSIYYHLI